MKYGLKEGGNKETEWLAKAEFEGEGSERKLSFYQVVLVSDHADTAKWSPMKIWNSINHGLNHRTSGKNKIVSL